MDSLALFKAWPCDFYWNAKFVVTPASNSLPDLPQAQAVP